MVSLELPGHLFEAKEALETLGSVQKCTPCCLALSPLSDIHFPSVSLWKCLHPICAPAEFPKC